MTTDNSNLLNAIDQALDERSLEWAAQWIQDSLKGETNERVIEFGNNMAMTLRAAVQPAASMPTEDRSQIFYDVIFKVAQTLGWQNAWPRPDDDSQWFLERPGNTQQQQGMMEVTTLEREIERLAAIVTPIGGEIKHLRECHATKGTHIIDCAIDQQRKGIWGKRRIDAAASTPTLLTNDETRKDAPEEVLVQPELPCPFCSGLEIVNCYDDGLYWKRCRTCGATGPETTKYSGSEGEPFTDWNSRGAMGIDKVQHRADEVVNAAIEWHQSGREGDNSWFVKGEALESAIDRLLELRDPPTTANTTTECVRPLSGGGQEVKNADCHVFDSLGLCVYCGVTKTDEIRDAHGGAGRKETR